jgi:hypothetical protein
MKLTEVSDISSATIDLKLGSRGRGGMVRLIHDHTPEQGWIVLPDLIIVQTLVGCDDTE